MDKPLMYDLYSGAGGAAKGYMDAGFRVVGVDLKAQPRYCGDGFLQMDALEFLARYLDGEFERAQAFHASPPCQGYSIMRNLPWLKDKVYPLLIDPTRELLQATGLPWVIENVMGAHLEAGWLCGTMFGLPFYRHRYFEANWLWLAPGHPKHDLPGHPRFERFVYGGTVKGLPGGSAGLDTKPRYNPVNTAWRQHHDGVTPKSLERWQGNGAQAAGVGVGHAKGWHLAAEAMGISWMKRDELTQAIPPAYTRHVGFQLIRQVADARRP